MTRHDTVFHFVWPTPMIFKLALVPSRVAPASIILQAVS